MNPAPPTPCFAAALVLGVVIASAPVATARNHPDGERRLELMRSAVAGLEAESSALPRAALAPQPLLRYSDPTRGGIQEAGANVLLDAAVWRLGTESRPTALVTTEMYQAGDASVVFACAFLSLPASPFSLKHPPQTVRWSPVSSGLALKELPGAPKPAATPAARLVQMRGLAKLFAVKERVNNAPIE